MKLSILLAFAFLALALVVVRAEDDSDTPSEDLKKRLMMRAGQIKEFFTKDPLGRKIVEQLQDLLLILKEIRQRVRTKLGNYLKELEESN